MIEWVLTVVLLIKQPSDYAKLVCSAAFWILDITKFI